MLPNKKSQRKKVLFFAESVTLAHMARPAVLADMLDDSEFEVVIARDPRYIALFPDLRARQIDIYSIPTEKFLEALAKGSPLYNVSDLQGYVEEDLRVIDQESPDIVVGDFRLSLSVSARLRNIPYVAISNSYWSPYARLSYTIPEHGLTRILGVSLAEAVFKMIRPIVFATHSQPLNNLRKRHGMKGLGLNLNRIYSDSDYLFYADVPSLVEMGTLPDNHQFLGPILWSPRQEFPQWWQDIDSNTPNIYLTMGSSGRSDLLPLIIEALKDLPIQLLVSTAGRSDVALTASNLFIADYLPGEAAAGISDLVICNGGSLTTYQAFSQAVPVLGIAGNLDQHLNMLAIEKLGAGMRLRTDKLNVGQLRAAVLKLLEEGTYTDSAENIRSDMAKINIKRQFSEYLRSV